MKVFGLAGWSGSGKTTLLVRLIPELTARGLTVSTLKHAHHKFDVDKPGKDSHRHREAGATEVLVASGRRWALMHELRREPEPDMDTLLARMSPVDLVIIEGFKAHAHDKLEVWRSETGERLLYPDDPHIVALATDQPVPQSSLPRFDIDDVAAIAGFILQRTGLSAKTG
ncbi:MAG: molybdopterin-guanine dinucleotide biosynthesis protein B [Rhodospirillaceae bacterium]|nr:molybdopterin-guanine dinucleotide biosynthesis protein B [Rhodospirillaceae bacterium]